MAEAQEQEEPLNEAKAGKILDTIYERLCHNKWLILTRNSV